MSDATEVIRIASDWLTQGEQVCLATIVTRKGSAPREVGAKMAISASGKVVGSIGGGAVEKQIMDRARQVIEAGNPLLLEFGLAGRSSDLDALCGGEISVFLEPLGHTKRLFVIGSGHVGKEVARLATGLGFLTTLVDDREEALSDERIPKSVCCVVASPDDLASKLRIDADCFVVICTRGHKLDRDWLRVLSPLRPRYLGMLGSKYKAKRILEDLAGEGIPDEVLSRVHVPVGLDIKAVTPGEIAVSIVGELILEWRGTGRA